MALTYSTMLELGTPAPAFDLPATDGKRYTLDHFKDARALLIVFTCNHCPYAKAVENRLIRIAKDYRAKGLAMVLISSNDTDAVPDDSFENMRQRAQEKAYPFPYLFDGSQDVARSYHAACTPDPYLFDAERRLAYRGQIDDNWQEPDKITRQDLREAIEATLAGRPVAEPQTPSMGCNIKWKEKG